MAGYPVRFMLTPAQLAMLIEGIDDWRPPTVFRTLLSQAESQKLA